MWIDVTSKTVDWDKPIACFSNGKFIPALLLTKNEHYTGEDTKRYTIFLDRAAVGENAISSNTYVTSDGFWWGQSDAKDIKQIIFNVIYDMTLPPSEPNEEMKAAVAEFIANHKEAGVL